jgi:hypothetical protein
MATSTGALRPTPEPLSHGAAVPPQVDQEADRPTVMADQVAHKDIDNVIVKRKHHCTGY